MPGDGKRSKDHSKKLKLSTKKPTKITYGPVPLGWCASGDVVHELDGGRAGPKGAAANDEGGQDLHLGKAQEGAAGPAGDVGHEDRSGAASPVPTEAQSGDEDGDIAPVRVSPPRPKRKSEDDAEGPDAGAAGDAGGDVQVTAVIPPRADGEVPAEVLALFMRVQRARDRERALKLEIAGIQTSVAAIMKELRNHGFA